MSCTLSRIHSKFVAIKDGKAKKLQQEPKRALEELMHNSPGRVHSYMCIQCHVAITLYDMLTFQLILAQLTSKDGIS